MSLIVTVCHYHIMIQMQGVDSAPCRQQWRPGLAPKTSATVRWMSTTKTQLARCCFMLFLYSGFCNSETCDFDEAGLFMKAFRTSLHSDASSTMVRPRISPMNVWPSEPVHLLSRDRSKDRYAGLICSTWNQRISRDSTGRRGCPAKLQSFGSKPCCLSLWNILFVFFSFSMAICFFIFFSVEARKLKFTTRHVEAKAGEEGTMNLQATQNITRYWFHLIPMISEHNTDTSRQICTHSLCLLPRTKPSENLGEGPTTYTATKREVSDKKKEREAAETFWFGKQHQKYEILAQQYLFNSDSLPSVDSFSIVLGLRETAVKLPVVASVCPFRHPCQWRYLAKELTPSTPLSRQ